MSENLTRAEQLLMWELFAAGGEKLLRDIEPKPKGTPHHALARKGFLKTSKSERSILMVLEDRGWRWIADSEPFPIASTEKRVTAERRLLQSLMRGIKRYADENGKPIQAMFRPTKKRSDPKPRPDEDKQPSRPAATLPGEQVEKAVVDAFFEVAGHPARGNIRLSELRAHLTGLAREDVDAALVALWRAKKANLTNLDNPRDIEAESAAALKTGVHTFHAVRILE